MAQDLANYPSTALWVVPLPISDGEDKKGVRRKRGTPHRNRPLLSWRKASLPYDESIEG